MLMHEKTCVIAIMDHHDLTVSDSMGNSIGRQRVICLSKPLTDRRFIDGFFLSENDVRNFGKTGMATKAAELQIFERTVVILALCLF